jgi:tetratricopeptide (TPR) repeat protein
MKMCTGWRLQDSRASPRARICCATLMAVLFVLSAPSWAQSQRDAVCQGSCGGGCGPCSSPSPGRVEREPRGPTQAEIADQAKRERAAAIFNSAIAAWDRQDYATARSFFSQYLELYPKNEVVRNNVALADNALGVDAYNRGDYVSALALFQNAAATQQHLKHPSHTDRVQENIGLAQKGLSVEKQEEDNRNASKTIQGIVDGLPKASALASTTSNLGFNDFGGASATTTKGAFGSNVADPKLVGGGAGPSKAGTDTNAGDQLVSAAEAGKHGGDLTPNYDKGTALSAGSLVFQKSSVDLSTFSERAKTDPQVISTVKELDSLQAKRSQLERERDDLIKQRNTAADGAAMAKATAQLEQKAKEYQNNLSVISEKSKELEKLHREIDAEVESPKAK